MKCFNFIRIRTCLFYEASSVEVVLRGCELFYFDSQHIGIMVHIIHRFESIHNISSCIDFSCKCKVALWSQVFLVPTLSSYVSDSHIHCNRNSKESKLPQTDNINNSSSCNLISYNCTFLSSGIPLFPRLFCLITSKT